ncbi:MAG: SGNH/GDSL hydrolase family protein [Chthoniobacterales bacterium]
MTLSHFARRLLLPLCLFALLPLCLFALLVTAPRGFAQSAPTFTQVVVFGDSLSDDGNIRHRLEDDYGISYPGGDFNYSDGRFTNSSDTDPGSDSYAGTWHEQLERDFLKLPNGAITNSLDGGTDYAFGGATTADGTIERTVISNPVPFGGGQLTVTVDNLGKQVDDYLSVSANTADPGALYIVWGGGNDLFDDHSDASVTQAATNVAGLVQHLAEAGARSILVPNVPPLGVVPLYKDDPETAAALNAASAEYRAKLNTDLDATVATLSGEGITITLYRLDVYSLFYRLAANPEDYGFTNTTDSAQGLSDVDPDTYLFWDDIHPTTAGHYQIASAAYALLNGTAQTPAQSLNLSSRLNVGTGDNVLIGGLIVAGTEPKQVLIRGLGPSLQVNGVPVANTLADPTLDLYQGSNLIQTNDNWKDTQEAGIEATGLAPTNDLESAISVTLDPGSYTVILRGKNSTTGIGLMEAYDLDTAAASTLANTSTRGFVQGGDDVLIAGFIVGNGGSDTVVVRAIGPSLADAGVANPLADPTLDLYDGNGNVIRSDDNWRDAQESLIASTGLAPTNDLESAIIRSLEPGNYTAIVRGNGGGTGVALVEVYNLQ